MRRRKRRKVSHMRSSLFIMTIIALSSIGVGYGYWSEGLDMDLLIETGDIDPQYGNIQTINKNNGKLDFKIDGKNLEISGWCYPGFSEVIEVEIINNGSIPIISDSIEGIIRNDNCGIYNLEINIDKSKEAKAATLSFDETETFDINYYNADYINSIIEDLDTIEHYSINKELHFEQGVK